MDDEVGELVLVDIRLQVAKMRLGERERVTCEACGAPTRERKQYCTDHVDQMPYVARLLEEMAGHQAEHDRVRQLGPEGVDPQSETSRELLCAIAMRSSNGSATVARLAVDLRLDEDVVASYLAALESRGAVKQRTTRGGLVQFVQVKAGAEGSAAA